MWFFWWGGQVMVTIAKVASSATGIEESVLINGLRDGELNWNTRVSWKIGASRKFVCRSMDVLTDFLTV